MGVLDELASSASGFLDMISPKRDIEMLGGPKQQPPVDEFQGISSGLMPPAVHSNEFSPDVIDQFIEGDSMAPKKMAYSHSMRDLIDRKFVADKAAPDPVPFYPSDRHIQKGLAPEQTLGEYELGRLAQVRNRALEYNVLTPQLADYMLPIAMVEGRPNSYGITHDNGFYASPTARRIFANMEIPIADLSNRLPPGATVADAERLGLTRDSPAVIIRDKKGDKHIRLTGEATDWKPELFAAILAIKAQGAKTAEEAVERWNGGGAQARHYRGKVQRAQELLTHPKNSGLINKWKEVTGDIE